MTAYNLEFTCHTGDTLEKILSHYRKSLKRDVAALRKEWVDMYFAHEEIDHPCKPTDLRCVWGGGRGGWGKRRMRDGLYNPEPRYE